MGHRLTTPDPAPICTRIVAAETQRHPGALTKWSLFGAVATCCNVEFTVHSHRTLSHCWIQIFRSVQAMTSLSAPMFFTEDPEVIWILRINVTTCENFAGQVSSAFKHSLRPIQFPLKISKNLKNLIPKYSKQIRLRKRSQRVWQSTVPFHTLSHVAEHAASPC